MLNWLGKILGLPEEFLACSEGQAGGVIQGTASEATLVALLGAKAKVINRVQEEHPEWDEAYIISRMVGYTSIQSHSSIERTGLLGEVKLCSLKADPNLQLRSETLEEAIKQDLADELIPFYAVCILGTTNTCAFDRLDEFGPVANKFNVWLHVDAPYAGSAFICPEYRHYMKGIEIADSFNFNFDCSAIWL
ncbi:aromatic-L-amino-acid decarboxylase-like [Sabethes cyaneus]|uniref:aromatic-L-amino-acid decarboxylase-like n=1 Tax=Sabethes cyaneus TaxID=53552 RepID=UPI00237D7071|nr:aromatic-L-amino-acid decarboxylase-like [Sabethes cyaneus]